MVVVVVADDCTVEQVDDCTRLCVESSLDIRQVAAHLTAAGWGRSRDPDTVWISVAALRAAGEVHSEPSDWLNRFTAMVHYAGAKCWLDDTSQHLAAHVVRPS